MSDTRAPGTPPHRLASHRARSLHSPRTRLEPITADHADLLFAGLCDPALYTWLDPPPGEVAALRRRFAFIAEPLRPDGDLWLNFAASRHGDGAFVGYVQATVPVEGPAQIAYFVFAAHQRHGYAQEASACLLRHLFDACGVTQVRIDVDTRNVASQRVAESLGFRREPDTRAVVNAGAPAFDFVYRLERPR